MNEVKKLYLLTLEVEPLEVNERYNPLPSHLTLVSRFISDKSAEQVSGIIEPTLSKTHGIELKFLESDNIGPNSTHVYLIDRSSELSELHRELIDKLEARGIEFNHPEFIRESWKPHVSVRANKTYSVGHTFICMYAYLIEVLKTDKGDERVIRQRFKLGS